MTKISFHTLGCRLNQAETASILNSFQSNGYQIVGEHESSDIVVVNTCTVTENGDSDTRRLVNRINRRNPLAKIALVGCQAQVQKEKLALLPNVRWIVGNQRKMDLVHVFQENQNPESACVIAPTIEREPFTLPVAAVDPTHTRANIKIQDGCDFFCSFCEIPYARGRARSRVFDDIVLEANALADAGHQEIIITGINLGTYQHEGKGLLHVIEAVEKIEGLKRIRISSIEPTTIAKDIFEFMGPGRKLCRYLHVPLQSGHDDVLKAMNRKYTTAEFLDFITKAVTNVPGICIGTDVIVGFPGETDENFEITDQFLRDAPVHYFHVFSYSNRSMAKSRHLEDEIPSKRIQERSQRLRDLSARKRRLFHQSLIGNRHEVLFEERKNNFWVGLTDNYARIKTSSDADLVNKIHPVDLVSIDGQNILGLIV